MPLEQSLFLATPQENRDSRIFLAHDEVVLRRIEDPCVKRVYLLLKLATDYLESPHLVENSQRILALIKSIARQALQRVKRCTYI